MSHDLTEVGKTYLLLLSRNLYVNSIPGPKRVGRTAARDGSRAVKFGAWYVVEANGNVHPAAPVMPSISSLAAFSQNIR